MINKANGQLPTVECNMLEGLVILLTESGNMWTKVSVIQQNKTGYYRLRASS